MEYLLPKMSLEFVLFAFPVLSLFLVVLQFGFVHQLGNDGFISQKGFAVALLVLMISPILLMVRTVIFSFNPEALSLYGLDMLFLFIVWGGLFYTLVNISSRVKRSKMILLQRTSAACSSIFAFMFAGALLHAT